MYGRTVSIGDEVEMAFDYMTFLTHQPSYFSSMDNAFAFDENVTGLCSEEEYPYAGHRHWLSGCMEAQGLCTDVPHSRVSSYVDVKNTTHSLMRAISKQPVSIAIEADKVSKHDL